MSESAESSPPLSTGMAAPHVSQNDFCWLTAPQLWQSQGAVTPPLCAFRAEGVNFAPMRSMARSAGFLR